MRNRTVFDQFYISFHTNHDRLIDYALYLAHSFTENKVDDMLLNFTGIFILSTGLLQLNKAFNCLCLCALRTMVSSLLTAYAKPLFCIRGEFICFQ